MEGEKVHMKKIPGGPTSQNAGSNDKKHTKSFQRTKQTEVDATQHHSMMLL